jgi:hypothetical protein
MEAMSGGQILFKLAAVRYSASGNLWERLLALAHNEFFGAAIVLYGALAVFWVWILTFTPLSRAYIFVAFGVRDYARRRSTLLRGTNLRSARCWYWTYYPGAFVHCGVNVANQT